MEVKEPRGRGSSRKDIQNYMGRIGKKYKKRGRMETPGDFFVIVDPYL